MKPKEKQDRFIHLLKVANRSGFVVESLSRGWRQRRRGSEASPCGGPGVSPWRAFGDFPRDGKVTRGMGRSAHTRGLWGQRPPLEECRGAAPLAGKLGTFSRPSAERKRERKRPPSKGTFEKSRRSRRSGGNASPPAGTAWNKDRGSSRPFGAAPRACPAPQSCRP